MMGVGGNVAHTQIMFYMSIESQIDVHGSTMVVYMYGIRGLLGDTHNCQHSTECTNKLF